MTTKIGDPKYIILGGKICNAETKIPIPDDEPIFILRAKDMLAEQAISMYMSLTATLDHKNAVAHRVNDFAEFRREHPDRMHMPDTVYPFPE